MKWTVDIEVTDNWVADGFVLTPDYIKRAMTSCSPLSLAYNYEIQCRVLAGPSLGEIAALQGGTAPALVGASSDSVTLGVQNDRSYRIDQNGEFIDPHRGY